jgi:pilus assembly protein FimV
MPELPSFGTLDSPASPPEAPKSTTPFRIAVLGDFSGRANRRAGAAPEELTGRRLLPIDRENFDDVLAGLGVRLPLPVGEDGETVALQFSSLDDFHPDQIFEKVDALQDAYDSDDRTELMNQLLHHPEFQALEACWRGVDWLLRRVQNEQLVEVVLLDVSRDEFAADLTSQEDLAQCGLYKLLIEKATQGPKGKPWAVFVGLYAFDATPKDADLLGRMARIGRHAAAPFLAAVPVKVLDAKYKVPAEAEPAWEELRKLADAAMLGLATPRFLLRLPYGGNTKSIDAFEYEEFSTKPDGKVHLWGNPALACACLLAQSFARTGWGFKPGAVNQLADMALHTYTDDDDDVVALTEVWTTTAMIQKANKLGVMVFLPVKGRDQMQLSRFQPLSVAVTQGLAGHWDQGAGVPKAAGTKRPAVSTTFAFTSGPAPAAPAAAAEAEGGEEGGGEEDTSSGDDFSSDSSGEEVPSDTDTGTEDLSSSSEEAPADTSGDAGMEGGGDSSETPAEEMPAESTDTSAEMDPELAELMKQLEGNTESGETPSE